MFNFLKKLFKKNKKADHPVKKADPKVTKTCPKAKPAEEIKAPVPAPAAPVAEPVAEKAPEIVEAPAETAPESTPAEAPAPVAEDKAEPAEAPVDVGKYIIKQLKSGGFVFSLKSDKDITVVTSGEYTLKRSCVSGIQSVQKNGITENIEDQTVENFEKQKNPKYEIFAADDGKVKYRLKAPNGYIILESQGYANAATCRRAINSVRKFANTETVEEEA